MTQSDVFAAAAPQPGTSSGTYLDAGARFSECGRYRYRLWRRWSHDPGMALFVMLNPSTADGAQDDPTIRRCVAFAQRWGCGALSVVNLFAFRSTDPAGLLTATDPVGPDNDEAIRQAAADASLVVMAWGAHAMAAERGRQVLPMLRAPHYLKLNRDGSPAHPLYLRSDLQPQRLMEHGVAS